MNSKPNIFYEQFDNNTAKLLTIADDIPFDLPSKNEGLKSIISVLRSGFKLCDTRNAVFKSPEVKLWAGSRKNIPVFSKSFCDSSCYIIFKKFPGEFDFMYISADKWPVGRHHCFLRHKKSGIIFDVTYDQYEMVGMEIPYDRGIKINPDSKDWDKDRALRLAAQLRVNLK